MRVKIAPKYFPRMMLPLGTLLEQTNAKVPFIAFRRISFLKSRKTSKLVVEADFINPYELQVGQTFVNC